MKHGGVYYTVEDAVEKIGFGPFQVIATIFTGMIWLSDAMEVMLLAVLSPIVKCEWDLSSWEQAMLTSVVFIGFLIGGLFWGILTDSIGRKTTLLIIGAIIFVFGMLSAASPSYVVLLVFRFLAGFGIGGSSQSVTYYVEFLSAKLRGVCIVLLALWWAIGSIFAAALALVVIPNLPDPLNWRLYLCLCAIPIGTVMTLFIFMPESARYYVSKGKTEKGEKIIKRIAWFNGKKPPLGKLVSQEEKERLIAEAKKDANSSSEEETESIMSNDNNNGIEESSFNEKQPLLIKSNSTLSPSKVDSQNFQPVVDSSAPGRIRVVIVSSFKEFVLGMKSLFLDKAWRTTTPLLCIWLGCAWLYYGSVLLTTTILEKGYNPSCGNANETVTDELCSNHTRSAAFYVEIVWTSSAEIPGIIITLIIIELIGRKITMAVEFIGTGLAFGLLLVCVPEQYLGVFLFAARGFATGVFQAAYVYTPEVYPTKYRGSAMGLMTSSARIGALVTPFIAQTLYHFNHIVTVSLYVGSCVVLAILSLLLPIETKGKSLKDSQ